MQVIINVPDNLPLATVEKFVQRIEKRLIRKAAIVEFKKPRPIGLAKSEFEVPKSFLNFSRFNRLARHGIFQNVVFPTPHNCNCCDLLK